MVLGAGALTSARAAGKVSGSGNPLRVGAALPDPPFELVADNGPAGFDIDLTRLIAKALGRPWLLVRYEGSDYNGIFAGLDRGQYDCVASGTTITPERQRMADFCRPYIVSGQSLVVDVKRHPAVRSTADLRGLVIGVQEGNTSEPVAEQLVARGDAGGVRRYAYSDIERALDDLTTGGCDAFMKLAPVTHWFVRDRPTLRVVQTGITRELLGICVRRGDAELRAAIDREQDKLIQDGTLARLVERWLGPGAELAGDAG
jgi:ABC-type amino acid transport substrate-binding protein